MTLTSFRRRVVSREDLPQLDGKLLSYSVGDFARKVGTAQAAFGLPELSTIFVEKATCCETEAIRKMIIREKYLLLLLNAQIGRNLKSN